MKKIYFTITTLFITLLSFGQTTGDIAFVAFNADGQDDFSIVALVDLTASTVIHFTDNEPNAAGNGNFDNNEGTLSWNTGGTIITAGTIVVFTDINNASNSLFGVSVGTLSVVNANVNFAGGGDAFYATIGDPSTNNVTTWLAGIQNEANNQGANFSTTGLTMGTTFVEFYTSGSPDGGEYTGVRTGEIAFSDYLALIGDSSNWTTQTSNGELILPIDTTVFEIAVAGIESDEIIGFSMYPNPVANGEFSINSSSNSERSVQIYDMLGKQVYAKTVLASENVQVTNLNAGIYILKVLEEGKTATRKLVIE